MRLTNEMAEVCRDYCKEVWAEVFSRTRVPATSEWRLAKNILFSENIQEVLAALPSPAALAFPLLE